MYCDVVEKSPRKSFTFSTSDLCGNYLLLNDLTIRGLAIDCRFVDAYHEVAMSMSEHERTATIMWSIVCLFRE